MAEWALVLDVLEDMETAEREESEDGDGPRVERTRQVHPRLDFFQLRWSTTKMLTKPELKQRDSRGYRNFRRHFRIPYEFFLELEQVAKHRKWFSLAARDVAGRQRIPVVLRTVEIAANSAKNVMWYKCVALGFGINPSTDRRPDRTILNVAPPVSSLFPPPFSFQLSYG